MPASVQGYVVLIWYGLYTFLMVSTAYYRLAGINIKY